MREVTSGGYNEGGRWRSSGRFVFSSGTFHQATDGGCSRREDNDSEELKGVDEERERASKPCNYSIPTTMGSQVNLRYKSQPIIPFGAI
eukprot:scaffold13501_cov303-Alexandrium_tamarense.AAC.2